MRFDGKLLHSIHHLVGVQTALYVSVYFVVPKNVMKKKKYSEFNRIFGGICLVLNRFQHRQPSKINRSMK